MIVYGSNLSPFVRKVLIVIAEKGLTTEHKPVGPHDESPEFRAASPLGKIPAFVDGDFKLADSSAICAYLEHRHPMPALVPSTAEDHGRMVWFEELADTMLSPAMGRVFLNLFVKPKFFKQPGDTAVAEKALTDEFPPLLDYLERAIDGPFLVGPALTLADIAVAQPLINLQICERPVDGTRWPKTCAWLSTLQARPSFQSSLDRKGAA